VSGWGDDGGEIKGSGGDDSGDGVGMGSFGDGGDDAVENKEFSCVNAFKMVTVRERKAR
jgi:hypothetical protein